MTRRLGRRLPRTPRRTEAYQGDYLLPHRQPAWLLLEERLRQAAAFGRGIEATSGVGVTRVCDALEQQADRLVQAAGSDQ